MVSVLVVDDEEIIVELLSEILVDAGMRTVEASTGRKALEILELCTFDLIVLDLLLSDVRGERLLLKLRMSEAHRHTPVLVISGADGSAEETTRRFGATAYLSKPFSLDAFLAQVRALLP
jgi:DNA-binding response OmpR family regulator